MSSVKVTRTGRPGGRRLDVSNADVRNRIGTLLNISTTENWKVVDFDMETNICLVTYDSPETTGELFMRDRPRPPRAFRNLHGLIVALGNHPKEDKVLADNYVFTPNAVVPRLEPDGSLLTINTNYGDTIDFDINTAIIRPYFECVVVRIFRYKGEDYFATSSRLQASTGRWGTSPSFYEMYTELGGKSHAELFGDKVNSDGVYAIMIAHPKIQAATLDVEAGLYETARFGLAVAEPSPLPGTHPVPQLSLTSANTFLTYGSGVVTVGEIPVGVDPAAEYLVSITEDPRLGSGESIMIISGDKHVHVRSPAYAWRFAIHGNTPNYLQRFIQLLDSRVLSQDVYDTNYPNLIKGVAGLDTTSQWGRVINLHQVFVHASPYSKREEAVQLLDTVFGVPPHGDYNSHDPAFIFYRNPDDTDTSYTYHKKNGLIFQIEAYLNDVMEAYIDKNIQPDKETLKIIHRANRTDATMNKPFDYQRSNNIHNLLFRPKTNYMISGIELNRLNREMKTYNVIKENERKEASNQFTEEDFPPLPSQ